LDIVLFPKVTPSEKTVLILKKLPRRKTACLAVGDFLDFSEECVTSLLGVSQQHGRVGFVEDWVVHSRVADTERSFHHNNLRNETSVNASPRQLIRELKVSELGSCHKRQKPQAPTPRAPIRNRQTRKVANAKLLNRYTNLT